MKKNVGITDRIIRFVIMDLLIGASISGFELIADYSLVLLVLGLLLVVPVLTGYSLIYHLIGYNTLDSKYRKEDLEEDQSQS